MMKKFLLLLISLTIAIGINADEALKREMRAAWVATVYRIDWPTSTNNASAQKAELNAYLDNLKAQNFNAIFFQVRSMCDAMYRHCASRSASTTSADAMSAIVPKSIRTSPSESRLSLSVKRHNAWTDARTTRTWRLCGR